MKGRRRKIQIVFSIFAATVAIMLGIAVTAYWKARRPTEEKPARDIVRQFPFSTVRDLVEWEDKLLARNRTDYSIAEVDGRRCIRANSEDSASVLLYRQELLSDQNPFISWDWKAEKFPSGKQKEALDKKKEFDFVAQVYVVFSARFFLNAKAIQYVWTKEVPVGTVNNSPYTKNVKLVVLESGPSEGWKHEYRDIKGDYRDLFGKELEKDVAAVAFMTDSDSTRTSATAYFDDITLGYLGEVERAPIVKKKKKRPKRSKRFPFLREE